MTDQVLTGVGAQLRQAREAAGLAMADVAWQLKLLPRQIESLEHERFERLPGPAITRGMVRNYARLLGLDPAPLLERMAPPVQAQPQVPSSTASRRSTLLYVGVCLVLLALIGAVAYEWRREKTAPESVPPVAPQRVEPAPPRTFH